MKGAWIRLEANISIDFIIDKMSVVILAGCPGSRLDEKAGVRPKPYGRDRQQMLRLATGRIRPWLQPQAQVRSCLLQPRSDRHAGRALGVTQMVRLDELMVARRCNFTDLRERLFFAGYGTCQAYMQGRDNRVSGTPTNSDIIADRSFWIDAYAGLTTKIPGCAADRIRELRGVGW